MSLGATVGMTIRTWNSRRSTADLMAVGGRGDRTRADASTAGARGPGGRAEVRVRRRAQRSGARQRAGDRRARGRRSVLQGVPGRVGDRGALPRGADRLREGGGSSAVPALADLDAIDASPVRCMDETRRARWSPRSIGSAGRRTPWVACSRWWLRSASGSRLVRALRPQAGRPSRARPHEHPIGERGRGGGRVRVGGEDRSKAHDEIVLTGRRIGRKTARAGGIEGGMSTGQPIRLRAAMKPFSTVPPVRSPTVDLATGRGRASHQAADRRVCGARGWGRGRGRRGLRARERRPGEVRRGLVG